MFFSLHLPADSIPHVCAHPPACFQLAQQSRTREAPLFAPILKRRPTRTKTHLWHREHLKQFPQCLVSENQSYWWKTKGVSHSRKIFQMKFSHSKMYLLFPYISHVIHGKSSTSMKWRHKQQFEFDTETTISNFIFHFAICKGNFFNFLKIFIFKIF